MSEQFKKIKKIQPATLIAMLALFIVIGGTATAASGLINGKKIKKGTVTVKAFKNQTITKTKISTAAIAGLQGAKGERGERGEAGARGNRGPTGDQGPTGAPGTVPIVATDTSNNQSANVNHDLIVLDDLPGSRYLLQAKVNVQSSSAGSQVVCTLTAFNGGGTDEARYTAQTNTGRGELWMVMSTTEIGGAKVTCNPGASTANFTTDLIATPAL